MTLLLAASTSEAVSLDRKRKLDDMKFLMFDDQEALTQ
jgi:hypothetical protein